MGASPPLFAMTHTLNVKFFKSFCKFTAKELKNVSIDNVEYKALKLLDSFCFVTSATYFQKVWKPTRIVKTSGKKKTLFLLNDKDDVFIVPWQGSARRTKTFAKNTLRKNIFVFFIDFDNTIFWNNLILD